MATTVCTTSSPSSRTCTRRGAQPGEEVEPAHADGLVAAARDGAAVRDEEEDDADREQHECHDRGEVPQEPVADGARDGGDGEQRRCPRHASVMMRPPATPGGTTDAAHRHLAGSREGRQRPAEARGQHVVGELGLGTPTGGDRPSRRAASGSASSSHNGVGDRGGIVGWVDDEAGLAVARPPRPLPRWRRRPAAHRPPRLRRTRCRNPPARGRPTGCGTTWRTRRPQPYERRQRRRRRPDRGSAPARRVSATSRSRRARSRPLPAMATTSVGDAVAQPRRGADQRVHALAGHEPADARRRAARRPAARSRAPRRGLAVGRRAGTNRVDVDARRHDDGGKRRARAARSPSCGRVAAGGHDQLGATQHRARAAAG